MTPVSIYRTSRQLFRLLQINRTLVRHGLDEIILVMPFLASVRFLYYFLPWNWRNVKRTKLGTRIRLALEELGPTFIKFGQALSTRRDLLPEDIADELAKLQDKVPPFSSVEAKEIIETSLARPIEELFAEFEEQPLASASIAQVHAATLYDGTEVVIKVVRPTIKPIIHQDIELMEMVADLAERYIPEARRLRPVAIVAEYKLIIMDELDLLREAASASQLKRNFEGTGLLKVPDIIWPMATSNVVVMERISGTQVNDIETLKSKGVDLEKLAVRGVEIFFTQVLTHNFFHADMHPGNIFVADHSPLDPQYIAIDFGIMGSLTPEDQRYLAENLFAFFHRDYRRVAELHVLSGWVPQRTRVNDFEAAIRTVCEPIFEKPLVEISFGQLLLRLFQTAHRFDMEIQPQLVLLQKTILNIEGLGRQLCPQLNLWSAAKPQIEQWMKEQLGLRAWVREIKYSAPRWNEVLPRLPSLTMDLLQQAQKGELEIKIRSQDLEGIKRELHATNRRTILSIVGVGMLVLAFTTYMSTLTTVPVIAGLPIVSWILGVFGAIVLLLSSKIKS